MPANVTEPVKHLARQTLSSDDADLVIAEFESSNLPLISNNYERVFLAVLHLADSDLQRFDRAWRLARDDWRDVLVADGLADEDWPAVLQRRGITPTIL